MTMSFLELERLRVSRVTASNYRGSITIVSNNKVWILNMTRKTAVRLELKRTFAFYVHIAPPQRLSNDWCKSRWCEFNIQYSKVLLNIMRKASLFVSNDLLNVQNVANIYFINKTNNNSLSNPNIKTKQKIH